MAVLVFLVSLLGIAIMTSIMKGFRGRVADAKKGSQFEREGAFLILFATGVALFWLNEAVLASLLGFSLMQVFNALVIEYSGKLGMSVIEVWSLFVIGLFAVVAMLRLIKIDEKKAQS